MPSDVIAGRFKLIREIGAGAMGSVWLAQHLALGTPVVVKLLKSDIARREDAKARFLREARIAAQMRSAHVVQVLDHGLTDEGEPFLVMEHLEGETLRDRLTRVKTLSVAETAAILVQVCRAMTKAHDAGLVHRDLKPENIFLTRDVDVDVVKVLDFGIVKVPDALAFDGVDPTRTGALLGTPCYMSPEQAQGLSNIDPRSDLWSLGVIAYECLTGILPFARRSLTALIAQITIGPIPVPSQSAPHARLGAAVDAWMARALSRDPLGRFASARELASELVCLAGTGDAARTGDATAADGEASPADTTAPAAERSAKATGDDAAGAMATRKDDGSRG